MCGFALELVDLFGEVVGFCVLDDTWGSSVVNCGDKKAGIIHALELGVCEEVQGRVVVGAAVTGRRNGGFIRRMQCELAVHRAGPGRFGGQPCSAGRPEVGD